MKMRDRMARFFERNERDFNRLMEIFEKEDVIFDSPALSLLYAPYAGGKRQRTVRFPKNKPANPASACDHPKSEEAGQRILAGHAL